MEQRLAARYDAIVVGAGHNGLVAACYLARAGRSVLVLERLDRVGGASVSARPFDGLDARLSRYAYLVSLLPDRILRDLGLSFRASPRRISSYTEVMGSSGGILIADADEQRTRATFERATGVTGALEAWRRFRGLTGRFARAVFPTLLEPLPSRSELRRRVGDDAAWSALVERPLGEAIEAAIADDVVRGMVLSDALIGTFAGAHDESLRQNRCFLYHVIGGGTGDWKVPIGGMGALVAELEQVARAGGATVVTGAEVTAIEADQRTAEVSFRTAEGEATAACDHVLAGCAPAVLERLLGRADAERPEGSQLKLNMLLAQLPRLRDDSVSPEDAFAGTFHVNESYDQLERARVQAAAGAIPDTVPCELYCHSLTDPSILGTDLRARGTQTLTLFALHLPARLFERDRQAQTEAAVAATLRSLDSVLAEPIESCLLRAPNGEVCLEAKTPLDLEDELRLPGGNIFHRELSWPFAEDESEHGGWGTETELASVQVCGAGARRGGGVSGIPGRNAAMAVLERGGARRTRARTGSRRVAEEPKSDSRGVRL
jgi:phytoene dehydrogenase-like protein